MLPDPDLTGSRRRDIHGLIDHGLGAPYLVHTHGFDHGRSSSNFF
jgi:hypothetical protein